MIFSKFGLHSNLTQTQHLRSSNMGKSKNQRNVVIRVEESEFGKLLKIADSIPQLMTQLTISDNLNEQQRFDANMQMQNLKWLPEFADRLNVRNTPSTDTQMLLTDTALKLVGKIADALPWTDDVRSTGTASKENCQAIIEKYLELNDLFSEDHKSFTLDKLLISIARSRKGSSLDELDEGSTVPRRAITTLATRMVDHNKEKEARKLERDTRAKRRSPEREPVEEKSSAPTSSKSSPAKGKKAQSKNTQ